MNMLEHLNLSSTVIGDDSIDSVACVGANLRYLNLSKTRVTSAGVVLLAHQLPKLESLALSHAPIDDLTISYISMMPSLKVIDVSNTNIKGFIHEVGAETSSTPSLTAFQRLSCLESLNLEHTQVRDAALDPVSSFHELKYISLRSASLTDETPYNLSSLSKLTSLSIRDAVLTNSGLDLFRPPSPLKILDLRGCWLLTKDAFSTFCKKHPVIEVRHELLVSSSNPISFCHSSPSRMLLRTPESNWKQRKSPMSQQCIDQRLKYSREELLALQHQVA